MIKRDIWNEFGDSYCEESKKWKAIYDRPSGCLIESERMENGLSNSNPYMLQQPASGATFRSIRANAPEVLPYINGGSDLSDDRELSSGVKGE